MKKKEFGRMTDALFVYAYMVKFMKNGSKPKNFTVTTKTRLSSVYCSSIMLRILPRYKNQFFPNSKKFYTAMEKATFLPFSSK